MEVKLLLERIVVKVSTLDKMVKFCSSNGRRVSNSLCSLTMILFKRRVSFVKMVKACSLSQTALTKAFCKEGSVMFPN